MRKFLTLRLVSLLLILLVGIGPAFADGYSGTVIASTYFTLTVQSGNTIKVFQIRHGVTKETQIPNIQDMVSVSYQQDKQSGALVANNITVTRKFTGSIKK